MSAALDMSLDDVVKQNKSRNNRRVGRGGRRVATKVKAPVGGIQKGTKAAKVATTSTASKVASTTGGDTKIIVSNLVCATTSLTRKTLLIPSQPRDVTEAMIKVCVS